MQVPKGDVSAVKIRLFNVKTCTCFAIIALALLPSMLTNAAASALLEDAPNPAMLPPHACLLVVYYKAMCGRIECAV